MRALGAASTPGLHCCFDVIEESEEGNWGWGSLFYLAAGKANGDDSKLVAVGQKFRLDGRGRSHDSSRIWK